VSSTSEESVSPGKRDLGARAAVNAGGARLKLLAALLGALERRDPSALVLENAHNVHGHARAASHLRARRKLSAAG
jgi:hypothetical protein